MKYIFYSMKYALVNLIFLTVVFTSNYASSESGIINCSVPDAQYPRLWKFSKKNDFFTLWIYSSDNFFPYCKSGYSLHFPNGFLCAYNADMKVGTIATFIDFQREQVTDILIWENTVLSDPNTWTQKSDNPCKIIRN